MTTCRCHAYRFPHRMGSGKCTADRYSVFCQECGMPCETHEEDHGIGGYEYCGAPGWDSRMVEVSDCCGAAVEDTPPPIAPSHTKPNTKESINV